MVFQQSRRARKGIISSHNTSNRKKCYGICPLNQSGFPSLASKHKKRPTADSTCSTPSFHSGQTYSTQSSHIAHLALEFPSQHGNFLRVCPNHGIMCDLETYPCASHGSSMFSISCQGSWNHSMVTEPSKVSAVELLIISQTVSWWDKSKSERLGDFRGG